MSTWEAISRNDALFLYSSAIWFLVIFALAAGLFETGEYGFKVAHVLNSPEPGDILFEKHRRWANRVFVLGFLNFVMTRVVATTAHIGFPTGGGMSVWFWMHIVIGLTCIALYFLARSVMNGVVQPKIHHWIVKIGLSGFFFFVIPSGIALYIVILMRVVERSHPS